MEPLSIPEKCLSERLAEALRTCAPTLIILGVSGALRDRVDKFEEWCNEIHDRLYEHFFKDLISVELADL